MGIITLKKGKHNVLSEANLILIGYNRSRFTTILDPKKILKWLKKLALALFPISERIPGILSHLLLGVYSTKKLAIKPSPVYYKSKQIIYIYGYGVAVQTPAVNNTVLKHSK